MASSDASTQRDFDDQHEPPPLPPRPAPGLPPRPRKRDSKQPEWIQILEDDLEDAEIKEKNQEPRKMFPSVAVTIGLAVLHILRMSWPGVNSNILSALLVAAKIHESLIIASLFHILYANIRRKLVGSQGIPFGYLTAPFQLSSPFYLFSSSFLAPLTQIHRLTLPAVWMVVLMTVSFLIAALCGASSGIVMLPKLGWWTTLSGTSRPYSMGPLESVYPRTMDRAHVPDYCPATNDTMSSRCAHWDYSNPNSIDWSWLANVARGTRGLPANLTSGSKSISWGEIYIPQIVVAATTPMKYSAAVVSDSFSMTKSDNVQNRETATITSSRGGHLTMKQPQVSIQCTDPSRPRKDPRGETLAEAPYNFLLTPGFYYRTDPTFFIPHELLDEAYTSEAHFGFLDLGDHAPVKASATFWTRYNMTGTSLALCFIDTRWVESDVWSYSNGDVPQFSYAMKNSTLNASANPDEVIHLTVPWLNSLNNSLYMAPGGSSNYGLKSSSRAANGSRFAYDRIWDYAAEGAEDSELYRALSRSLAIYLVDALSDLTWSRADLYRGQNYSIEQVLREEGIQDYAWVDVDRHELIYQYNFEGLSVKLAFGVLLLHVLLVLVHFVGTACIYRGFGSSAWEQLGELMTLAMNSQGSDLLKNTGVGVHKWEVWRLMARVCEDEFEERRVELRLHSEQVLDGDEERVMKDVSETGKKPTAFRKYG
ncbi:hypothetical protein QBC40DRAFT_328627 [Triangularia verruculosa]|uniref:Tyrosinase copper-binding domain-containing protein n=1 Tax=Triangularia verruculosa TaxID=2587418 RepID=A0AAN6XFX1_9PEZI|nr:hypothetical protein QBC40DRAFT_328627 [Triangularia verruculosa]